MGILQRRYVRFAITTRGLGRHSSKESCSRHGTVPSYPLVSIRVREQQLRWKCFCHIRHITYQVHHTFRYIAHTLFENIPAKHKESTEKDKHNRSSRPKSYTTPSVILHTSCKNIPAKHKESTEKDKPNTSSPSNPKWATLETYYIPVSQGRTGNFAPLC